MDTFDFIVLFYLYIRMVKVYKVFPNSGNLQLPAIYILDDLLLLPTALTEHFPNSLIK